MGFPGSPVGKESACNSEPSLMAEAHVGPLQHRHHGGPEKASTLMKGQFELDFPDSSADNRPATQETPV